MPMPWFRLYSELLSDRKLQHTARIADVDGVIVIGLWAGILCLANDSPERGALLLTHEMPLTAHDIAREVGMDEGLCAKLIDIFDELQMLTKNVDRWVVTRWHTRQFISDDSTARVRQWREQKRAEGDDETAGEQSGDDETKRCSNVEGTNDSVLICSDLVCSESESKEPGCDINKPLHMQRDKAPPTIRAFRKLTNLCPAPGSPRWNAIAQLPQDERAVDKWRLVVREWTLRGYKAKNIAGMLDWFHDGIPPRGSPWKVKEQMEAQANEQAGAAALKEDIEGYYKMEEALRAQEADDERQT